MHWWFIGVFKRYVCSWKHTDGFCFIRLAFNYAPIANPALRSLRASFQAYYNLDFFYPSCFTLCLPCSDFQRTCWAERQVSKKHFHGSLHHSPMPNKNWFFCPPAAAYPWNSMPWLPTFEGLQKQIMWQIELPFLYIYLYQDRKFISSYCRCGLEIRLLH